MQEDTTYRINAAQRLMFNGIFHQLRLSHTFLQQSLSHGDKLSRFSQLEDCDEMGWHGDTCPTLGYIGIGGEWGFPQGSDSADCDGFSSETGQRVDACIAANQRAKDACDGSQFIAWGGPTSGTGPSDRHQQFGAERRQF